MSFSQELIDKFAPEAQCIQAMKIWKLPDGKENMFPQVCNSGDYFAELKKDGYWYQFEKTEHYSYLFKSCQGTPYPAERFPYSDHARIHRGRRRTSSTSSASRRGFR